MRTLCFKIDLCHSYHSDACRQDFPASARLGEGKEKGPAWYQTPFWLRVSLCWG